MAWTPTSGTQGGLALPAVGTVGGIKNWKLSKKATAIAIPHFASPVDANGTVWPAQLAGLAGATVSFNGQFNSDASTALETYFGISVGLFVIMNLYTSKTLQFGYQNVLVLITAFDPDANIENQPLTFSGEGTVSGICPPATGGLPAFSYILPGS